jgi:hypothetical protein
VVLSAVELERAGVLSLRAACRSSHAEVLLEAHRIRVQRDDYNIGQVHLADAIEALVARSQDSLSADRSPADPYTRQPA